MILISYIIHEKMKGELVNMIQAMLAPGIMISACGLLLLGMNNKYSIVVNRIRLLDDEKRRLATKHDAGEMHLKEKKRLLSIRIQLLKLAYRVKLVRNAVMAYTIAVGLFITSCVTIGFQYIFSAEPIFYMALVIFLLGMTSVFVGAIMAAIESYRGYEIVQIELKEEY